jgi:hypothetical protein
MTQLTAETTTTEPPISQVIERFRERDALVGWRFEAYNDPTATWIQTTILDGHRTEADIHEQHSPLRQLTPLVSVDAVIALLNDEGHTAAVSTLLDPLPHDGESTTRHTQLRATVEPAAPDTTGDDHE